MPPTGRLDEQDWSGERGLFASAGVLCCACATAVLPCWLAVWLAGWLACWLAGWLAGLPAGLPAGFRGCRCAPCLLLPCIPELERHSS